MTTSIFISLQNAFLLLATNKSYGLGFKGKVVKNPTMKS